MLKGLRDLVPIPLGKEKVVIGNRKELRVLAVYRLNIRLHHATTDFDVTLQHVFFPREIYCRVVHRVAESQGGLHSSGFFAGMVQRSPAIACCCAMSPLSEISGRKRCSDPFGYALLEQSRSSSVIFVGSMLL